MFLHWLRPLAELLGCDHLIPPPRGCLPYYPAFNACKTDYRCPINLTNLLIKHHLPLEYLACLRVKSAEYSSWRALQVFLLAYWLLSKNQSDVLVSSSIQRLGSYRLE